MLRYVDKLSCLYEILYVVGAVLACVKDLIRALRTDDSQCEIRRQLGRAGILKKVWHGGYVN